MKQDNIMNFILIRLNKEKEICDNLFCMYDHRYWLCSVPENEDSLGLEGILSLDNVFNVIFTIVVNFSPHVVYHEWLSEVVFIV